jgi:hypothetical protein
MVEATPERLAISGVAGALNTIYFSESGTFTNFTIGLLDTSPFTAVISAPGSRVTHIRWGCGKLLWWKDQSFGYLTGDTQFNIENIIVSDNIGTIDNSSSMDPGGSIWFRGQEGHVYTYDCSSLEKKSIDIGPNVQASGNRTSNSWTLDSESEFSDGNTVSSTTIFSTGVQISTNTTNVCNNSFGGTIASGGDFNADVGLGQCWRENAVGRFGKSSGGFTLDNCTFSNDDTSYVNYDSTAAAFSTMVAELVDTNLTMVSSTSVSWVVDSCAHSTRTIPSASTSYRKQLMRIRLYPSNDSNDKFLSDRFVYNGNPITFRTSSDTVFTTTKRFIIDQFEGGVTSFLHGLYFSPVKNAPNITTWDSFNSEKTDDNGSHTFFLRSSTNTFTVLSSTPSWSQIINNALITISTGTYFQYKDSFTVSYASHNPVLQSSTVNWFEGAASDKAYSIYFNDAIWWSVAFGDGQSSNNYVFKYDLINDGWTLYDFGAGGFLVQNNRLHFGSTASDGIVYRFGESNSDNGSAIDSYWKSKDFTGADPWLENQFKQIDTYWGRNSNQTATFTYGINTTTTTTSYTVNLSSATQSIIRNKKLLPSGKTGDLFNFKVSDDSTNSPWEFFGMRTIFDVLPYRPSQ